MKNKMLLPTVLVIVVVIAGIALAISPYGSSVFTSGQEKEMMKKSAESSTEVMEKNETAMGKENTTSETMVKASSYGGQIIAGSTTPYLRYNELDFANAKSGGKAIYLYFYATWCPICAAERPNILGAFDDLGLENAVGFEAHWSDGQNTEADNNLAREYGVGSQHTHIFIGKDGSVVEKTLTGLSRGDIKTKLTEVAQA